MNDNYPSKLTIIIVGILALLVIAILPIAPSLFRSTAPTLTFSPLQVDDPLTQLSGDSIEDLFARDTIADLSLTLDTPIIELDNHTLREVFESPIPALENLPTNGDFSDGTTGWSGRVSYTSISNVSNALRVTINNVVKYLISINVAVTTNATDIFYFKVSVKAPYNTMFSVTNRSDFGYGEDNTLDLGQPTANQWTTLSGAKKFISAQSILNFGYRLNNSYVNTDFFEIDNVNVFNITASHGVTATSGTAYDNAVAEIEWLLSKNDGYIQSVGNPFELVDLTVEDMDYYYSLYQELIDLDGGLPAQYSNGIYTNDDVIIYVTPLITSQQYSPLFDSTFDVMSDADIEDQMDDWLLRAFNYPQLNYELTEAQLLYFATLNQEFIDLDGGLPNTISYDIFTSNDLLFDLAPLKMNHQYSPLYQKTFDMMSDAEIIAQMNEWEYLGYLPQ